MNGVLFVMGHAKGLVYGFIAILGCLCCIYILVAIIKI